MKKQNKIMVVVAQDEKERKRLVQRLAVRLGFAMTPGDAAKVIRPTAWDWDLDQSYFVLAYQFNFRESPHTAQQLFQMAARGMAVVVGCRRIPKEYEFFCEIFTDEDMC